MKNKRTKVLVVVFSIIMLLWICAFVTDYYRCNSLKHPVFVIAKETADDGGSGTYYGLGYRVEVRKNISANYGIQIESLEMRFFNKVIAASISDNNDDSNDKGFIGTIIEAKETYIVVKPNDNESEIKTADKIQIGYKEKKNAEKYSVGTKVIIKYDGTIMETYPARIANAEISIIK